MKKYLVLTKINKKVRKNSFYLNNSSYNYQKQDSLLDHNILFRDKFKKKDFYKDRVYLKSINEKILLFLSGHLNRKFSLKNDIGYWRIILYYWLSTYTAQQYYIWLSINKLKNKGKYHIETLKNDSEIFRNKDYLHFSQKVNCHFYNFFVIKRIINYCNLKNIIFIKSKNIIENIKLKEKKNLINIKLLFFKYLDLILSIISFKVNRICFDSLIYPLKYFINLCFKLKIIPSKNINFFKNQKSINTKLYNTKKRNQNLLKITKNKHDKFYNYLLENILIDLPMSYYESFESIRNQILNKSKNKKIIFSMHSILTNDLFKIYVAETKKIGSKLICVDHGGQIHKHRALFDHLNLICDEQVHWNIRDKNYKFSNRLSPTLINPSLKLQNTKDNFCTVLTSEPQVFKTRCHSIPGLDDWIREFEDVLFLCKSLKPTIKKKLKLRAKHLNNIDINKKFSKAFGKDSIDNFNSNSDFKKTISKSKLIIFTYPQTSYLESMYYNKPSILLLWKKDWIFQDIFYKHIKIFEKNNMAFEKMKTASKFINKDWNNIEEWWGSNRVQTSRKAFLNDFFKINKNWHQDWTNYIKKQRRKLG